MRTDVQYGNDMVEPHRVSIFVYTRFVQVI